MYCYRRLAQASLLTTQEAVLNLYIGKLKPLLTTDKWMPPAVSKEQQ